MGRLNQYPRASLALLALVVAALALLASALDGERTAIDQQARFRPFAIPTPAGAHGQAESQAPAAEIAAPTPLFGIAGLVALVVIVVLVARRNWRPLLMGIVLIWLIALIIPNELTPPRPPLPPIFEPGDPVPPPPEPAINPSSGTVVALSALIMVLLAVVAWLVITRSRRAPPARPPERQVDQLAEQARQSLDALGSGQSLGSVITSCYVNMSTILTTQSGLEPNAALTPREFEQRMAGLGLHDQPVRELTALFERCRYGAVPAGEAEERQAVACLTVIAQRYGAAL